MKPEEMERMQQYFLRKRLDIPMCSNCVHFEMHYVRSGRVYTAVHEGHCMEPRIKPREAWDICQHFTPKEASAPAPAQTK